MKVCSGRNSAEKSRRPASIWNQRPFDIEVASTLAAGSILQCRPGRLSTSLRKSPIRLSSSMLGVGPATLFEANHICRGGPSFWWSTIGTRMSSDTVTASFPDPSRPQEEKPLNMNKGLKRAPTHQGFSPSK